MRDILEGFEEKEEVRIHNSLNRGEKIKNRRFMWTEDTEETKQSATTKEDDIYSFEEAVSMLTEGMDIMDYFNICKKTKYTIENFMPMIEMIRG